MKKLSVIAMAILLIAVAAWAADTTYQTKFYVHQGGDRAVVASGGSLDVESGGEIDIESGGSLKLAGTAITPTAAELNKLASIGSGGLVTTTNTATLTGKTLSGTVTLSAATLSGGATLDGTFAGGTLSAPTLTGTIPASGATVTSPTVTGLDAAFNVATHSFAAGEDWTLSASEQKALLLTTSSGSGTPSIIAPSTSGKIYVLRNGANVDLILKRSGGTGITVASGKTAILLDNGSDYVRVTADATH